MNAIPRDLRGLRDRALILTGFAGAFMSHELRALKVEDIQFDESMIISVGESLKRRVYIGPGLHPSTCPVWKRPFPNSGRQREHLPSPAIGFHNRC